MPRDPGHPRQALDRQGFYLEHPGFCMLLGGPGAQPRRWLRVSGTRNAGAGPQGTPSRGRVGGWGVLTPRAPEVRLARARLIHSILRSLVHFLWAFPVSLAFPPECGGSLGSSSLLLSVVTKGT